MKRRKTTLLIAIILIFAATVPTRAKGKKPPEMVDSSIEGKLAVQFNVDKPLVMSLRNMGYNEEEIIRILLIYVTTETPIVQITNLYKQGTKWDDIAHKYEINTDVFNKETINRLIYIGKVEKAEHTEDDVINKILKPMKE